MVRTPESRSPGPGDPSMQAPDVSRVKYTIQFDKKIGTTKDTGVDTEPHLLFEDIHDLYDENGELDEKYKYLLQLNRNRGAEGRPG